MPMNGRRHRPDAGSWPYVHPRRLPLLFLRDKNGDIARRSVMLTWMLRAGLVADGTYVTNAHKRDGIGSQLVHTLVMQAFADAFSVPYAHSPITSVSQKLRSFEQDTIASWESYLDLGSGYPAVAELDLPVISLGDYVRSPSLWKKPCVISHVGPACYQDLNPAAFERVVARRRAVFARQRAPLSGEAAVAIHVRRGDVTAGRHPKRFTPTAAIRDHIRRLRRALEANGLGARITVYSDGQIDELAELSDGTTEIRANGPPLQDFMAMQASDILLIGKSNFSFLAGLFHLRDLVLHESSWLRPRKTWLNIDRVESGLGPLLRDRGLIAEAAQRVMGKERDRCVRRLGLG